MKLNTAESLLLTNTTNSSEFKVVASAKMFKILSSTIYERKIEAIIRELSCNAYDSHVQAGYPDRPFKVGLPNRWNPEFVVEDFGVGLDHEEITKIYTSYGESTKTHTDDLIGAFGLGSKTPFAYTDTFNIRARKDGMERTYNAYIGAAGIPSVTMLSESETNEPNGVRVSVPVRDADFGAFRRDAQKVFAWFTVLPEVYGNELYTVDNEIAHKLMENPIYVDNDNEVDVVYAIMGQVSYRVSPASAILEGKINDSYTKFLKNSTTYIRFPIGSLEVSASRETISFEEDTTERFVEILVESIDNYTQSTQNRIDTEAKTIIDAREIVDEEMGPWSYGIFTFQGVELDLLLEERWTDYMLSLIRDYGRVEVKNKFMTRSKYRHSQEYHIQDLTYRWGNYSFREACPGFVFLDVEYDVNTTRNAKRILEETKAGQLIFVVGMTENLKKALKETFGHGEDEMFFDNRKINEKIREERRLAKLEEIKEAEAQGKKIERAKKITKQEVRLIGYMLKDDTATVEFERYHKAWKVDLDKFDGKKMVLMGRNSAGDIYTAGVCKDDPGFSVVEMRRFTEPNCKFITKFYDVDGIILVHHRDMERLLRLTKDRVTWVNAQKYSQRIDRNILNQVLRDQYLVGVENANDIYREHHQSRIPLMSSRIKPGPVTQAALSMIDECDYDEGCYISFGDVSRFAHHIYQTISTEVKADINRIIEQYPLLQYTNSATPDDLLEEYMDMVDKALDSES